MWDNFFGHRQFPKWLKNDYEERMHFSFPLWYKPFPVCSPHTDIKEKKGPNSTPPLNRIW